MRGRWGRGVAEINLTRLHTDAEEAGTNQEESRSCGEHGGHLRTRESGTASKVIGGGHPQSHMGVKKCQKANCFFHLQSLQEGWAWQGETPGHLCRSQKRCRPQSAPTSWSQRSFQSGRLKDEEGPKSTATEGAAEEEKQAEVSRASEKAVYGRAAILQFTPGTLLASQVI